MKGGSLQAGDAWSPGSSKMVRTRDASPSSQKASRAARQTAPALLPRDLLVTAADPGTSLTRRKLTHLQVQHILRPASAEALGTLRESFRGP